MYLEEHNRIVFAATRLMKKEKPGQSSKNVAKMVAKAIVERYIDEDTPEKMVKGYVKRHK